MEQEYTPQVQPVSPTPEGGGAGQPQTFQERPVMGSGESTPSSNREMPGVAQQPMQQVVVPRPVVPQPVPQTNDDNSTTLDNRGSSNPTTADDVDVIEKEWVDRAKQIVEQTRTDPHEQEKKVSQLQADYLKKRYGKEVQLVEE